VTFLLIRLALSCSPLSIFTYVEKCVAAVPHFAAGLWQLALGSPTLAAQA
jgi:hypothetical protein